MQHITTLPQPAVEHETKPVAISLGDVILAGDLYVPEEAKGIVVFAHGSGSSRFSPRNRYVAEVFNERKIGTLLIDLLTLDEEQIDRQTRELRFDIELLAERLGKIGQWIPKQPWSQRMKLGYFGASTGAAAAFVAAAGHPESVTTVVSRGGRPDLALSVLSKVKAPSLLIVGEYDPKVLAWNKEALSLLNKQSRLEIVPKATHLFEEPGALEVAARLAADWFNKHFKKEAPPEP